MTQRLTGATLLAEVNSNPKMADAELAMRTGYTRPTRSRSGEEKIKPDLQAYYKAMLLATGNYFGLVMPESERGSSRNNDLDSFKIQKNNAGIVPGRFFKKLGCAPGEYFLIKEGEDGTLLIEKDAERSEAARLEAAANPAITADDSEDDEEEEEDPDEDADDDEDEEEEVVAQQPTISGVSSTTVRIPQSATVS